MASHQFLSMKNFLGQSESLEKSKLDGKRKTYGEKVLREGRKGIIYVLKFSFSV